MATISPHYMNPVFSLEGAQPSRTDEPISSPNTESGIGFDIPTNPSETTPLEQRMVKQLNPDIQELPALEMKILKAGAMALGSIVAGGVISSLVESGISMIGSGVMLAMGWFSGCSRTWDQAKSQSHYQSWRSTIPGKEYDFHTMHNADGSNTINPGAQPDPIDQGWCGTLGSGLGFLHTIIGGPLRYIASMIPQMFLMNAVRALYSEIADLPKEISFDRKVSELSRMDQDTYDTQLAEAVEKTLEDFRATVDYKPLETLNAEHPSRALMPILARLKMIQENLNQCFEEATELAKQGNLAGADEKVRNEMVGLIRKVVYYKHLILDPTRPQMGVTIGNSYTGEAYHSLLSHYTGQSMPFSLNPFHNPGETFAEFHKVLTEEEILYNEIVKHFNGVNENSKPSTVEETGSTESENTQPTVVNEG